jgi:hypothetical protein
MRSKEKEVLKKATRPECFEHYWEQHYNFTYPCPKCPHKFECIMGSGIEGIASGFTRNTHDID